ncbi:glycosyltransferase family 2 protein [Piscicoccus intestinalis]|uniref:glycosyltransferase family 2 protein n=1 Tax=Piscicoccus intestinalis TaxID=746033 RepID=UPI0008397302|nr:glycosyltransferase family 2 protein [Piscicoccus intestinalis]
MAELGGSPVGSTVTIHDAFGSGTVLTIVVPTYKRPDLLVQCLRSLAAQTFTGFVVLVCDNSPEREAQQVVESLGDERFRYLPRNENLGMLRNVLAGFMEASTEFVMEVDDDDLLYPECVEELLAPFASHPALTIVFGDLVVIDDDLQVMPLQRRVKYLPSLDFLAEGVHQPFTSLAAHGYVFLMASIIRRDCIDWAGVPDSAATAYDRYLTLAASRGDAAGYFVRKAVMAYRVHERSDGLRFTTQSLRGALDVLTREVPRTAPGSRKWVEREVARTRLQLLRALRATNDRQGVRDQARSLMAPPGIRALAYLALRQYLPQQLRLARSVTRDRLRNAPLGRTPGR